MKRAAALLLLALPPPLAAQRFQPPAAVLAAAQARVDSGPATAVVIGIVDAAGSRYWAFGRLARDSAAPAADSATVFEIGSITKVFTATLLADLVVRGEASLDEPVRRLLPDTVRVPARDGREITLRDIASHRSALPRLPNNLFSGRADIRNPYVHYGTAELYAFLGAYTLPRDIGQRYEYSNLAVGLLGHALARRVGTSYEAALTRRVLQPLRLADTRVTMTDTLRRRLARPYNRQGQSSTWDFDALAGAGALRSTATDMARFLAIQLGLVRSPLDSAIALTHVVQAETGRPGSSVALAWHTLQRGGLTIYAHDGGTGGYRTIVAFDATRRVGVLVLSNSDAEIGDLALRTLGLPDR